MSASTGGPRPLTAAPAPGCEPIGHTRGWVWIVVPLAILATLAALIVIGTYLGPVRSPPDTFPPFWPIFPFGFILVVLLGLLALRGWGWGRGGWGYPGGYGDFSAREELRRRYARGEISRDQFLAMARDLDTVP